jgi:hypothetical protein
MTWRRVSMGHKKAEAGRPRLGAESNLPGCPGRLPNVSYVALSRTHITKKRACFGYSLIPVLGFVRQGRKILWYPGRSSGQSVNCSAIIASNFVLSELLRLWVDTAEPLRHNYRASSARTAHNGST